MVTPSNTWKDIQQQAILPETFVEISCNISEVGLQEAAEVTGANEDIISEVGNILGTKQVSSMATKYATLERNLWVLDGSRSIAPASSPRPNVGYVGELDFDTGVVVTLPAVRTAEIPGVTIMWSSEYGEYPTAFSVTAKNGTAEVATITVENNDSNLSVVDLPMSNYDSVAISVSEWCLPDHRTRIDRVTLGHSIVFDKNDIISYTHEQYGDLNSGEIPKNSIEFSVDNTDGKWNPANPSGLVKYLAERQRITVRYGMDIGGAVEWIKAGTFYLSEWRTPSSGVIATFVARDIFEYLMNESYTGVTSGTLQQLVQGALSSSDVPEDFTADVDGSLGNYSATIVNEYSAAEVVQMCANATCCVMYQDREGVLHIKPFNGAHTGYILGTELAFFHPEMDLSKQLKNVSVSYTGSEEPFVLNVGTKGETQTVDNPIVSTRQQAADIAAWVRNMMKTRKSVSGEFRADPCLDVFDVITIESKYGSISPVVITDILYRYTGSFTASYKGRVISSSSDPAILGQMILGVSILGQGA